MGDRDFRLPSSLAVAARIKLCQYHALCPLSDATRIAML